MQNLITSIRETVAFFVQDLSDKKHFEYDSTDWANSLKNDVDDFLREHPDKAPALDKVLEEEGRRLLNAVTKGIAN